MSKSMTISSRLAVREFSSSDGALSMRADADRRIVRAMYNGVEPRSEDEVFDMMTPDVAAMSLQNTLLFYGTGRVWDTMSDEWISVSEHLRATPNGRQSPVWLSVLLHMKRAPSKEDRDKFEKAIGFPRTFGPKKWSLYSIAIRAERLAISLGDYSDREHECPPTVRSKSAFLDCFPEREKHGAVLTLLASRASALGMQNCLGRLLDWMQQLSPETFDLKGALLERNLEVYHLRHRAGTIPTEELDSLLCRLWNQAVDRSKASPNTFMHLIDEIEKIYRQQLEIVSEKSTVKLHRSWKGILRRALSYQGMIFDSDVDEASVSTLDSVISRNWAALERREISGISAQRRRKLIDGLWSRLVRRADLSSPDMVVYFDVLAAIHQRRLSYISGEERQTALSWWRSLLSGWLEMSWQSRQETIAAATEDASYLDESDRFVLNRAVA